MKEKWLASVKLHFFGFLSQRWSLSKMQRTQKREARRSTKLTPMALKKSDEVW